MLSEHDFHEKVEAAFGDLEDRVTPLADECDFEVEAGRGMLTFTFEAPTPGKFILSPNSPVRQIWVSALSTSFKFGWDEAAGTFVLDRTGEPFLSVIGNLLKKQLGRDVKL